MLHREHCVGSGEGVLVSTRYRRMPGVVVGQVTVGAGVDTVARDLVVADVDAAAVVADVAGAQVMERVGVVGVVVVVVDEFLQAAGGCEVSEFPPQAIANGFRWSRDSKSNTCRIAGQISGSIPAAPQEHPEQQRQPCPCCLRRSEFQSQSRGLSWSHWSEWREWYCCYLNWYRLARRVMRGDR